MRKSKAGKAETRQHIVEVAAKMFKSQGIGATPVGDIMVAAGLTHSAFYRHFTSKEALVAEASSSSMDVFVDAAETALAAGPAAFVKHFEDYMTTEYRNGELGGCPIAQLGSELAQADQTTRQGVSDGLEKLIDMAVKLTDGSPASEADAIFTMCALTGAITVSRLVNNPELSARILDIAKARIATFVKAEKTSRPKTKPRRNVAPASAA